MTVNVKMKKIHWFASVFLAILATGVFIFSEKARHLFLSEKSVPQQVQISDNEDPMMPKREPKPEVKAKDWDIVGVYHNIRYGFRVEYPAGNFIRSPEIHAAPEHGEVFLEKEGLRYISFYGKPANDTNACQAIIEENNQWIFEKSVSIDGRSAVVMHELWQGKESPEIKLGCVMENETAYFIHTEYVDHERIWNSFRFEE